jgi:hypothetical protein
VTKKKTDDAPTVSVGRINELVDVIVPRPGCVTDNGEAAALALVELANMAAGNGYSFAGEIDSGGCVAYYIARAAFTRTQHFEDALTGWQGNTIEAALEKKGDTR